MFSQFDKEKAKKNLALVFDEMRTEVDPQLLNEYRSLFKKEVSFFRRSWTAAYLFMLYDQGALNQAEKKRGRKAGGGRMPDKQRSFQEPKAGVNFPADESSRYPALGEEESKRLFINIGRNRRVFPREILGLINAKTAISREDIGTIRILDNYSFVQVRDSAADTIINALNGQSFRGRILSVDYARPRKDGGEENRDPDAGIYDAGGDPDEAEPEEADRFSGGLETNELSRPGDAT